MNSSSLTTNFYCQSFRRSETLLDSLDSHKDRPEEGSTVGIDEEEYMGPHEEGKACSVLDCENMVACTYDYKEGHRAGCSWYMVK